jgi:hypothetical protein
MRLNLGIDHVFPAHTRVGTTEYSFRPKVDGYDESKSPVLSTPSRLSKRVNALNQDTSYPSNAGNGTICTQTRRDRAPAVPGPDIRLFISTSKLQNVRST